MCSTGDCFGCRYMNHAGYIPPKKGEAVSKPGKKNYYMNAEGEIQYVRTNDNHLVAVIDPHSQNDLQRFIDIVQGIAHSKGDINLHGVYQDALLKFAHRTGPNEPEESTAYADDGRRIWVRHPKTKMWTVVGSAMAPRTWDELCASEDVVVKYL